MSLFPSVVPTETCAFAAQINLVATQLVLDREHNNRLVFDGQEGLDPVVDLSLRGAKIRALIQGRASTWHNNLLLTPISSPAGEAVGLPPLAAARLAVGVATCNGDLSA